MKSTFQGTARLRATLQQFEGEEKADLAIAFTIDLQDAGACTVQVDDFRFEPIEIDVLGSSSFTLKVKLASPATGRWSREDASLQLQALLEFDLPGPNAKLKLALDTAGHHRLPASDFEYEGRPADKATGALALAAMGKFSGSLIAGRHCMVLLEGTLTPNPWADPA